MISKQNKSNHNRTIRISEILPWFAIGKYLFVTVNKVAAMGMTYEIISDLFSRFTDDRRCERL